MGLMRLLCMLGLFCPLLIIYAYLPLYAMATAGMSDWAILTVSAILQTLPMLGFLYAGEYFRIRGELSAGSLVLASFVLSIILSVTSFHMLGNDFGPAQGGAIAIGFSGFYFAWIWLTTSDQSDKPMIDEQHLGGHSPEPSRNLHS